LQSLLTVPSGFQPQRDLPLGEDFVVVVVVVVVVPLFFVITFA